VNTSPVTFWTLCGGHADAVSASNGKTYWVSLDCHSTGALYAVDVTIPQSAGNVAKQLADNRRLVSLTWSDDVHVSRISRGSMQDWVVVSVESGGDGFTAGVAGWYPFKQELFMVNVLSGAVQRLAHHRSRGDLGANYFWQPRVSASWDGSYIAWTSNFGFSQSGYADLYVIDTDIPAASVPASTPSTSTSTSTSPSTSTSTSPSTSTSTGSLSEAQLNQIAYARNWNGTYGGGGISAELFYQQRFGGGSSGGSSSSSGSTSAAPSSLSAAQLAQIEFARNWDGSYPGGLSAAAYYQARFGGGGSSSASSGGASSASSAPGGLSEAQLNQIAFARNWDGSYGPGMSASAFYELQKNAGKF